jgi:DNA-binding transcriptional regulator LsrR (DeoR family)
MAAARRSIGSGGDARRDVAVAVLEGRLTGAEAARELGTSREVVRRWVRRERRAGFVAVDVVDDAAACPGLVVEVVMGASRVLRAPATIEPAALIRLVRALESC